MSVASQRSLSVSAETVRCLLPEFDHVSLTVLDDAGAPYTSAYAGDLASALDELQYTSGDGPCIDSMRNADTVTAAHIGRDGRWRHYAPAATGTGLRSQISAPLVWHDRKVLGALNIYCTTRGELDPTASLVAQTLALQIAATLSSLREIEHLDRALASRTTIAAAIGMLMERHQLTEKAAFAVLQRRSSHANVKLRTIAEQMVAEHSAAGLELPLVAHC